MHDRHNGTKHGGVPPDPPEGGDSAAEALAHEARSALAALSGRVQLIRRAGRRGALTEARLTAELSALETSIRRLTELIDLLAAAAERGQDAPNPEH